MIEDPPSLRELDEYHKPINKKFCHKFEYLTIFLYDPGLLSNQIYTLVDNGIMTNSDVEKYKKFLDQTVGLYLINDDKTPNVLSEYVNIIENNLARHFNENPKIDFGKKSAFHLAREIKNSIRVPSGQQANAEVVFSNVNNVTNTITCNAMSNKCKYMAYIINRHIEYYELKKTIYKSIRELINQFENIKDCSDHFKRMDNENY